MFGLFQSPQAKLEKRYTKLLEESHRLSTIDREASDRKAAEADEVLRELKALEASSASS